MFLINVSKKKGMLNSFIALTLTPFLFLPAFSSALYAQDDIEEFVDRYTAAFVVIEEPGRVLEQLEASTFFQNRHFNRALELLTDEKFSLFSPADLETAINKWEALRDSLGQISEVTIIIHSWKAADDSDGQTLTTPLPKFSLVLVGAPETNESVASKLSLGKSGILETVANQGKNATSEFEEEDIPVDDPYDEYGPTDVFSALLGDLDKMVVKQVGNAVVVSNDATQSAELIARFENTPDNKFRSLSKQRTYQQVQKLLDKKGRNPGIRGFILPKNFPELTAQLITESFELEPKTLPAAGFQVSLEDGVEDIETPDGTYRPIVSWDYVMTFTQPATEYGKMIESFEPVDALPTFPFTITQLKVLGFDLEKRNQAHKEITKIHQLSEKLEQEKQQLEAEANEDDGVEQIIIEPASGDSDSLSSYLNIPERTGDAVDEFEELGDYEAYGFLGDLKSFDPQALAGAFNGLVEFVRLSQPNDVVKGEKTRFYRVKDPELMEGFFQQMLNAVNEFLREEDKLTQVDCDHGRLYKKSESAIRKYWKLRLEGIREVPETGPLGDEILCGEFEIFFNDQWLIYADHVTIRRFLKAVYEEDAEPQTFGRLLEATQKRSEQEQFFKVLYHSNRSLKNEERDSIEDTRIWDKYRKDDKKLEEIFDAAPDEYGLRNEVESSADATAAIKQLIVYAFNDTFGTSMSMFSTSENSLRLFGQTYSLVESENQ